MKKPITNGARVIASHLGSDWQRISNRELVERTGFGTRYVEKSLSELVDRKFVTSRHVRHDGGTESPRELRLTEAGLRQIAELGGTKS